MARGSKFKKKNKELNFLRINIYELLGFDFDYSSLTVNTLQDALEKYVKSYYFVVPQNLKIELVY